jgi:uncharacterized membrane protein YhaH (DUF805 family)
MEFANAIKYGFKNYANFKGVIDRRTFWWWYLFAVGTLMLLALISMIVSIATNANDAYIVDGTMVEATDGIASVSSLIANLVSLGLALSYGNHLPTSNYHQRYGR